MNSENCCVVSCEKPLDQNFWDAQYQAKITGWDLGEVSPAIKVYIESLANKNISILIPGCGNTYEASYLLEQGFTNVTVIDIAPTLVKNLNKKFSDDKNIKVFLGDFFDLEGKYDLIIEQTFFCALPPTMRQKYIWKMHQLLSDNGILAGLLFNREFEVSPPFGGSKSEYELLFKDAFQFLRLDFATNSIAPRANVELFFEFKKNKNAIVNLYQFEGITCTGCKNTVTEKFSSIEVILNVNMNTDFSEVLIVGSKPILIENLENCIAYDQKYSIKIIR